MKPQAIIFYGPPGSGKTTQARLLSLKLHLVFFDTGRFLKKVLDDPDRADDPVIKKEKELFDGGVLMTPKFVLREVLNQTKLIAKTKQGIVYCGSPRTMYEAEGLMPLLEKLYGKENVHVILLDVSEKAAQKRNVARLICKTCNTPLLTEYYPSKNPKNCPICGGDFYKRPDDRPEVIKIRYDEYEERTEPIFGYLKKRGYKLRKVDGTLPPYKVFNKIYGHFEKSG